MKLPDILIMAILIIPFYAFEKLNQTSAAVGTLQVEVTGLKSNNGQLGILLFDQNDGFPSDLSKAYKELLIPIKTGMTSHTFKNLPYGKYAVAVMHDENMNDKLDTNFLGIPKEGTGVSNNVKGKLGAPKFEDASFSLDREMYTVKINVSY